MKLILFGGAEGEAEVVPELKIIESVMRRFQPRQILHIPFARTVTSEPAWAEGWFERNIEVPGAEYLNAKRENDIARADQPLVFISGGHEHVSLMTKLNADERLLKLINNASVIIGESAGSMALGAFFLSGLREGEPKILKGLGLIKNTLIVPHYRERNRQEVLKQKMKEVGAAYGLGIDCLTAIEFELTDFPEKYQIIGERGIEIKKLNQI